MADREPVKVSRDIHSHSSHIQAHTEVLLAVESIPIQAYTYVIENPSNSTTLPNLSNSTHIKNPSYCEVVK